MSDTAYREWLNENGPRLFVDGYGMTNAATIERAFAAGCLSASTASEARERELRQALRRARALAQAERGPPSALAISNRIIDVIDKALGEP